MKDDIEIEDLVRGIEEKEAAQGKSFDRHLSIDGIPVWYFYKRFFTQYTISFIPSMLLTTDDIKRFDIGKAGLIKRTVIAKAIPKAIWINEMRKIRRFQGRRQQLPKGKNVIFLSYSNHIHGKNIFRLQRILDIMEERGNLNAIPVFADPFPSTKFKILDGRMNIYSFITKRMIEEARSSGREIAKRWQDIQHKEHLLSDKKYWRLLKPTFDFLFSKELLTISILYYKAFRRLLSSGDVVLAAGTGLDSIHEKAMIAAAHKEGIPSLAIQHCGGVLDLPEKIEYLTDISTFNEDDKRLIEKHGLDPEHIHISGPVIYDDAAKHAGRKKTKGKSVFVATSPVVEDGFLDRTTYFKRVRKVLEGINEAKPDRVTIKLHPRERFLSSYERIIEGMPNTMILPGDISGDEFYNVIAEHDAFVHFGSNAAVEAMIIKRPVVTISIADEDYDKDFFTSWLTKDEVSINEPYSGDIKKAIENAFSQDSDMESKVDRYILNRCGVIDGRCSERIVDSIERIANR